MALRAIKDCRIFLFFYACKCRKKSCLRKLKNSSSPFFHTVSMIVLANSSLIEPDAPFILKREFFLGTAFLKSTFQRQSCSGEASLNMSMV